MFCDTTSVATQVITIYTLSAPAAEICSDKCIVGTYCMLRVAIIATRYTHMFGLYDYTDIVLLWADFYLQQETVDVSRRFN